MIDTPASCGGAFPASIPIRCSRGFWPATRRKGFATSCSRTCVDTTSQYVRNTAIVETILTDANGGKVRISDFAPHFEHSSAHSVRRRSSAASSRSPDLPRVAIRVRPTHDYGRPVTEYASSAPITSAIWAERSLRLSTDAPLSYIVDEITFPLTRPVNLIFGQDEPFLSAIDATRREFLDRTRDYWHGWVRYLGVPFEWQAAVVRAAITLKLCSFEETGAIVAAHTTSIPEALGTSRNWDYRYCWLRDAYFVVDALNRLGATQTMESYINYITTIAVEDASDPARARHRAFHPA